MVRKAMRGGHRVALRIAALAGMCLALAVPSAVAKNPTPPGPEFDGLPAEYASAFVAKEACSRRFVAGGDIEPLRNDARIAGTVLAPGFIADLAEVEIDREARSVTVEMPGYPPRRAVYTGSQGCVIVPAYSGRLHFEPRAVPWRGPSAKRRWPIGERVWHGRSAIDREAMATAIRRYMQSPGTRAVVVVHKGELVGESYAPEFGVRTPQRAWSTSKSITASLAGLMVDRGKLRLGRRAPIREWAGREDPRREITLRQLLNMSSGLFQNQFEGSERSLETFTPRNGHAFIYFDGFDTYQDALESWLEVPPGTRWQYRNANVLAVAATILRALPGSDPTRLGRFAQRRLLEPLGMRSTTLETDPYGHYIASGATYTTARDLARLGLLHLRGGRIGGNRILSQRWVRFVRKPAPTTSGYGGFWWLNREHQHLAGVPESAYFASGAFGQTALVIPSHDLVIARMGFSFPDDEGMGEFAPAIIRAVESGEAAGREPSGRKRPTRPPRVRGSTTRGVVFVANAEDGTVSLVDSRRLRVIREINVIPDGDQAQLGEDDPLQALAGQQIVELAGGANLVQDQDLSPDGRILYVSRGHRGDVAAFRIRTGELLWKVPISGFRSDHMTLSADGRRLYVSAMTANVVEVIDARRGAKIGSFPTGDWPHDNHISDDGERIYNASIGNILLPEQARTLMPGSYSVTVADPLTLDVLRTFELDRGIRPFALTADESRMYAQLSLFNGLVEIDPANGEIRRRLELPVDEGVGEDDFDFEAPHHGLALSPDERTLCVAGRISDYAALVSTKRLRLRRGGLIDVGDAPSWAANGPGGGRCFVANNRDDTLSAISYRKRAELARIRVGNGPKQLESARIPRRVALGAVD